MGEFDRERRVKLVVDEWGAWHKQDPDVPPGYLYAYAGTLRDGLISAMNLDTFQRHADKVAMANPAQLVNTIHSLFHTYEDKFILTPNYHVFEMYMAHAGATALRTEFIAPKVSFTRLDAQRKEITAGLWGLNGSASLKDKQLVLTVVNPHHNEVRETEIAIRGASIKAGESRTLTASDLHARNSFANPRTRTKERASKRERLEYGLSVCPSVGDTAHVYFKLTLLFSVQPLCSLCLCG